MEIIITGPGKTMPPFKPAQPIATSGSADKVVFLPDRIEPGIRPLDEHPVYKPYFEGNN